MGEESAQGSLKEQGYTSEFLKNTRFFYLQFKVLSPP
jgi:hypothetical protein